MTNSNFSNPTPAEASAPVPPSRDTSADPQTLLAALRDELDGVDVVLLETLRHRLDCCRRIGLLKKAHAIPMMQPQRIGVVQARAADFAQAHGMNGEFLRALYEIVIAETCRLEDEVIGAVP
ncbi:MAG: chorismate mutase family protein [Pseudomonadota bacterium]|nr:chorismate mutase family protein [Pseudomonadota bacterium]